MYVDLQAAPTTPTPIFIFLLLFLVLVRGRTNKLVFFFTLFHH